MSNLPLLYLAYIKQRGVELIFTFSNKIRGTMNCRETQTNFIIYQEMQTQKQFKWLANRCFLLHTLDKSIPDINLVCYTLSKKWKMDIFLIKRLMFLLVSRTSCVFFIRNIKQHTKQTIYQVGYPGRGPQRTQKPTERNRKFTARNI